MSIKNSTYRRIDEFSDVALIITLSLGLVAFTLWSMGVVVSTLTAAHADLATVIFVSILSGIGSLTGYAAIAWVCITAVRTILRWAARMM